MALSQLLYIDDRDPSADAGRGRRLVSVTEVVNAVTLTRSRGQVSGHAHAGISRLVWGSPLHG